MQNRLIAMENLSELLMLQLEKGGRTRLTVTGCSMQPMLVHHRDVVELIPVSQKQKAGDLILYRRKTGEYILHRIIAEADGGYICCGDNQAMREPVDHDQLLAVVDGFVRKGKHYTVEDPGYRLYTAVWVKLFFLRKPYIVVRRCLGRLYNKIRKRLLKK